MSPGSARMVVLAWCGRVWVVVADWAAGFGCCGTVVVVGAGGRGVVGVPRGSGPWSGAVWLDPGPGRGVAPCWRARWRAPRPVLVFLARWVSGVGEPPCPCGGNGERACQRCASWRLVLRPLT